MSDNISAIDKAIQAAQARKLAKLNADNASQADEAPKASKPAKAPKPPKEPKRPRVSDEEKVARVNAKNAERAAKKLEREAKRAAKKAERANNKKAPHMSKVEKAASKLPALTHEAQVMFNDITANFSAHQIAALSAHLQHFNRATATSRAVGQVLSVGDKVRIVSGDSRFVGEVGEVFKVQRIRCYVTVAGASKPVYLFTSDVELKTVALDQVAESA